MQAAPIPFNQKTALGLASAFLVAKLAMADAFVMSGGSGRPLLGFLFSAWFLAPNLLVVAWALWLASEVRRTAPEVSIVLRLICAMDFVLLVVLYFGKS